jgi:hypothetical protein
LRRVSWSSLAPSFEGYAHTEAVGHFVEQVGRELCPLALILFGSLARGDHHQRSDADFCVVLPQTPHSIFEGYGGVAACDTSGAVQPVVYGPASQRPGSGGHGRRPVSGR